MDRKRLFQLWGVCGLAALLLGGCQQDEIRSYKAPKPAEIRDETAADKPKTRLLAALIPHGSHTWFFKLSGPEHDVAAHKDEFDRLLLSVHLTDQKDQPISWTTPEAWEQLAGTEMRYATLRPKTKDNPLEISVTDLPPSAASVLPNVNRWRGQLSLPPISEADLPKFIKQLKIGQVTATLVDFSGVSKEGSKMPPFARRRPPAPETGRVEASHSGVKYTRPDGWQESPGQRGGFRLAGFRVTEGDKNAEITITPLSAASGSLLANVNRWRDQVGLPEISEDQLRREVQEIEVAGSRSPYVDLSGKLRILGVIVAHGEQTWYFKMIGDADLVGKQKSTFETFLRSVRFDGGN
jgi:hypothetical protein